MQIDNKSISKRLGNIEQRLSKIESLIKQQSLNSYSNDYEDPLLKDVIKSIKDLKFLSASFIQRKFTVGYARAARILDQLEANGYIGSAIGSKPRKVLKRSGKT